jgi:Flp pilus assembly protein TadD
VPLASLWSGFWRRLFGARTTEEPGRNLDHINSEASQENSGGVLTPQHNVDHLLAQAVDLYGNGDYIKSVEVLMSVLEQNSSHLEANRLVGNTLLVLRKPDLAESYLFKAVQLSNWTDASLVSNLAESLRLNGDIDLALRVLERGYLSINQTDPTGRIPFEFGVLYERTGNYSDAADWYLVSALTQSVNADAWLRASTLLFPPTSWNLKFAENVLSRAVQMNPSNVALIFDLGVVLQSSGRPDEAIILYYEVLRLDPDHDGAVANLASALHSMNRKEEAIILYDKILLTALSLVTESRAFPQIGGVAIALGNFATLLLEEDMSVRKAVKVAYYASQIDRSSANLKRIYTNALQRLDESTLATRSEFISLVMSGKWIEASAFLISNDYYRDEAWFNFATGMVEFFR